MNEIIALIPITMLKKNIKIIGGLGSGLRSISMPVVKATIVHTTKTIVKIIIGHTAMLQLLQIKEL